MDATTAASASAGVPTTQSNRRQGVRTTANGHALLQLDPDPDPQAEQAAAAAAFYDPQMFASPYYRYPGTAVYRPAIFRAVDDGSAGESGSSSTEWEMRHGFENQLNSHEYADLLSSNFFMYFTDKRHESGGRPKPRMEALTEWRMRDRQKTSQAVLFLCLNIGIHPPDVVKSKPCPRFECWIDTTRPHGTTSQHLNSQIGKSLQQQYEQLSIRTQYKHCPDPTVDDIAKYQAHLRRALPVRERERLLFHYTGHGVPRPTASGELWFFNKNYTQYIPMPLFDLLSKLGAPTVFVFDCSDAGVLIDHYVRFAQDHPNKVAQVRGYEDCIHLAACRAGEMLPANPDLPADLFTSCLTTPIEMAIRHFLLQTPLPGQYDVDEVGQIPGKASERKSPLGELNWIFTAITDTIAWNSLDATLFKRLFRQDLMIAALFRNFLLAQRVMRKYGAHPVSFPLLPDMHEHPLWESWDLAVHLMLAQLPDLRASQAPANGPGQLPVLPAPTIGPNAGASSRFPGPAAPTDNLRTSAIAPPPPPPPRPPAATGPAAIYGISAQQSTGRVADYVYQNSTFFSDQLTAFEVYLSQGALAGQVPQQLPIVMQVLLSQNHRLRALILLSKFLDLGPWAVNHALSIGIHPYVLKLLQSQALELKPVMVYIWSRILAMDRTCQFDLLKDNSWRYFSHILIIRDSDIPLANLYEHRAMCAFVLATFCHQNPSGRRACLSVELVEALLRYAVYPENALLRQWSCLCLADIWRANPDGQWLGIRASAHQRLSELVCDPVVEVRTACVATMSTLLGLPETSIQAFSGNASGAVNRVLVVEESLAAVVLVLGGDGSPIVRREVVRFYAEWVPRFSARMSVVAYESILEEAEIGADNDALTGPTMIGPPGSWPNRIQPLGTTPAQRTMPPNPLSRMMAGSVCPAVWRQLLTLAADPNPEVADGAQMVVDNVMDRLLRSALRANDGLVGMINQVVADDTFDPGSDAGLGADRLPLSGHATGSAGSHNRTGPATQGGSSGAAEGANNPALGPVGGLARAESYLALGIRRTASVAASLKQFAFGGLTSPTKGRHPDGLSPGFGPSPTHDTTAGTAAPGSPRPPPQRAVTWARSEDADKENPARAGGASKPASGQQQPAPGAPPEHRFEMPGPTPFFDWCTEYFREPQMKAADADEPGSADYNDRLIRRNRNDRIIAKTQPLKTWAATTRWEKHKAVLPTGQSIRHAVFHQFEDELVLVDGTDGLAVWDWRAGVRLTRFRNGNPAGSTITSVRLINEDEAAVVMTGSSDGCVRLFRDSGSNPTPVAAFRALSDMVPPDRGGLVLDWQQASGHLLVAGDVRLIRVWNAGTEMCVADIPARSGSVITSLTSDQVEGQLFAAAFADGAVRVYDRRIRPADAMVRVWREHRDSVVGLHLQRGGRRELVSASRDGVIKLWDIRVDRAIASVSVPDRISTLAVHEHAPIFAIGTAKRAVQLFNMNVISSAPQAGRSSSNRSQAPPPLSPRIVNPSTVGLSNALSLATAAAAPTPTYMLGAHSGSATGLFSAFVPSSSFLGLRVPTVPISALAFHPHRMVLSAAADGDPHVVIVGCGGKRGGDEDY